ncbi:hypothetical protein ACQP1O_22525 [Nocardia sp. CA-151230]|uniref:hypothetical protein n=1 Tax=Nocardia sp. CA-151230 TaxID=3239982 RepID=UPI003D8F3D2F
MTAESAQTDDSNQEGASGHPMQPKYAELTASPEENLVIDDVNVPLSPSPSVIDDVDVRSRAGHVPLIMELASLPMLSVAVRGLAKNPEKLGAYLPSVVTGFVDGWRKLDAARGWLRKERAERKGSLAREVEAAEAEMLARVPAIRRALDAAISEMNMSLAALRIELISERDEHQRARLEVEIGQTEQALEIQRGLLNELRPRARSQFS